MQLLAAGPRTCPECGGPRLLNGRWEYEPGFRHGLDCVYRRAPTRLADLGGRAFLRPHIQNWLLDDVLPAVEAYVVATGQRPTRLLVEPRFAPLFAIIAKHVHLEVVGDTRCPHGRLFVVGHDWDGQLA